MSLQRVKRKWLFDSPVGPAGDRFRRENIPSEDSYRIYSSAVAFISENDDASKTWERGLIMLYTDEESIDGKYRYPLSDLEDGDVRAIRAHQLPGVGVMHMHSGDYYEPVFSPIADINARGQGIQTIAVSANQFPGIKKLSYAVKLDPGNLPVYVKQSDSVTKVILHDEVNDVTGLGDAASFDKYFYEQKSFSTVWEVNHDLEKFPAVTIFDLSMEQIIAKVIHTDTNNLKIKFNQAMAGAVACS